MTMIFAGLMAAAALFASEPSSIAGNGVDAVGAAAAGAKPLMVCARDDASKRAFKREFGRAIYVSADEVIAGRGNGERWDTPRCITPAQLARLRRLMNETTYTQIASR